MVYEESDYWTFFNAFFLFGPKKLQLILQHFASLKKAWNSSQNTLSELNLGKNTLQKFDEFKKTFNGQEYLDKIHRLKLEVVTLLDDNYPKSLKEIYDPPAVLYFRSELNLKDIFRRNCIAVVGSRAITSYGKIVTQKITAGLVRENIVIVSGLARGVDICAHRTALEKGGLTVAVLGCGLDRIYPANHVQFAEEIIKKGALVSEFPLGMPARPENFPIRNRIISGLSMGLIVTEAAQKSGTLITAGFAADQGKDVFCVPGPITSPNFEGVASLLKKGAILITQVSDILQELGIAEAGKKDKFYDIKNLDKSEECVVKALVSGPMKIDAIVRHTGLDTSLVISTITRLEIKGAVANDNGMIYSKVWI